MTEQKTIATFLREHPELRIEVGAGKRECSDDGWESDRYRVRLKYKGRSMTLIYKKGIGHRGSPPQLDEVIDGIRSDSGDLDLTEKRGGHLEEEFTDWAESLGYDPDSRKAHQVWKACRVQTEKAITLLGADVFAELLDCEGL